MGRGASILFSVGERKELGNVTSRKYAKSKCQRKDERGCEPCHVVERKDVPRKINTKYIAGRTHKIRGGGNIAETPYVALRNH